MAASDWTLSRALLGDRDARRRLAADVFGIAGLAVEPTYHGLAAHRERLIRTHSIGHVLDVGANTGQYAKALLASGYQGLVTSFEPNPRAAKELRATAAGRPAWTVHEVALTSSEGRMTLHVTDDSQSTSLLVPTQGAGKVRGQGCDLQVCAGVTGVACVTGVAQEAEMGVLIPTLSARTTPADAIFADHRDTYPTRAGRSPAGPAGLDAGPA